MQTWSELCAYGLNHGNAFRPWWTLIPKTMSMWHAPKSTTHQVFTWIVSSIHGVTGSGVWINHQASTCSPVMILAVQVAYVLLLQHLSTWFNSWYFELRVAWVVGLCSSQHSCILLCDVSAVCHVLPKQLELYEEMRPPTIAIEVWTHIFKITPRKQCKRLDASANRVSQLLAQQLMFGLLDWQNIICKWNQIETNVNLCPAFTEHSDCLQIAKMSWSV